MADFHKRNEALTLDWKDSPNSPKSSEIPEIKELSPGKSVSSDDTRESTATSCGSEEEGLLPDFIRKRKYSEDPETADQQLWEDIQKEAVNTGGRFLDQKFIKYIFIDTETGKAYVKIPTLYHRDVVDGLRVCVNRQATTPKPVLAKTDGGIDLKKDLETQPDISKYPDVYIFGTDRTRNYGTKCKKRRSNDGSKEDMNPNAIIEVSWTHGICSKLTKLKDQMTKCKPELGSINVGYLIKFIPKKKGQYPTKKHPNRPLVGIDVYQMKAGDEEPKLFRSWRHGEVNNPADLKITAEELGQGDQGEGVSIPFKTIIDELLENDVKFEKPGEN